MKFYVYVIIIWFLKSGSKSKLSKLTVKKCIFPEEDTLMDSEYTKKVLKKIATKEIQLKRQ